MITVVVIFIFKNIKDRHMKITGENGFLYSQLYNKLPEDNYLFLLGSPTFDDELTRENSIKLHEYVKETIELINNNKDKYIIFASSTGVDDIDYEHKGYMTYTIAKLYLENYIITYCEEYLILRIGTIISNNKELILKMKNSRIQQKILNKTIKEYPNQMFLTLDNFLSETISAIKNKTIGIYHYSLTPMNFLQLLKYTYGK